MLPDLPAILETLVGHGVEFVIIGGMAAGGPDILGELAGGARYEDLVPGSTALELFGHRVRVMGLRDLLRAKENLGRPKDEAVIEILRETLRLKEQRGEDKDEGDT